MFIKRTKNQYKVVLASGITYHMVWEDQISGVLEIKDERRKLGLISFWKTPSFPNYLTLNYVGVEKNFRRQGLASDALRYLKKEAKRQGFTHVEAQITWTGAFKMMEKIFGTPVSISDAIREYTKRELHEKLPKQSPEKNGRIENADYLEVVWKL